MAKSARKVTAQMPWPLDNKLEYAATVFIPVEELMELPTPQRDVLLEGIAKVIAAASPSAMQETRE